ncbi:MAG: hypothetical protein HC880_03965 [Bacteroidia bacterium]|nr:hypothetical protein [Bacteroidia bacterium]
MRKTGDKLLTAALKKLDNRQQAAFFKDIIEHKGLLDEAVTRPELVEA